MADFAKIVLSGRLEDLISKLKISRDSLLLNETPSIEVTKKLTGMICEHFQNLGFWVSREVLCQTQYSSAGSKREPYSRNGLIDIVVASNDGWQLAIEVDRGNKKWSLKKLKNFQTTNANSHGIWIRWGGVVSGVETKDIFLIDLTETEAKFVLPFARG
jgi:hypothetical protein